MPQYKVTSNKLIVEHWQYILISTTHDDAFLRCPLWTCEECYKHFPRCTDDNNRCPCYMYSTHYLTRKVKYFINQLEKEDDQL